MAVSPWLDWSQRLAALAQSGLAYADNPFDEQRYAQVRAIAAEMVAAHAGGETGAYVDRLAGDSGYATPKLDTRAIVVRDARILLVRERSDGRWTPPGGFVDVGEGPRSAVEREAREESGFEVRATRLLAVFDRHQHAHPPALHHAWKAFFACEVTGGEAAASVETTDVGFFDPADLPPLSSPRITAAQIARALEVLADPTRDAHFD